MRWGEVGARCGIRAHLLTEYFVLIYLFLTYINYVKYGFHYETSHVYSNSDHIRPHCPLISHFWLMPLLFQSLLPTLISLLGDPISLIKVTLGAWVWGYSQENGSLLVATSLKKIFPPPIASFNCS